MGTRCNFFHAPARDLRRWLSVDATEDRTYGLMINGGWVDEEPLVLLCRRGQTLVIDGRHRLGAAPGDLLVPVWLQFVSLMPAG